MPDISFLMLMHMIIGTAVVFSGAMSLSLSKGSPQHIFAGRLFVGTTLLMGPVVFAGAFFYPGSISPLGILFMCFIIYLVVSAWSTIHKSKCKLSLIDKSAPFVAACISAAGMIMGINSLINPNEVSGAPVMEAYFFFSAIAFISMLLDANNLMRGGARGKHRIVRHVWRMSFAMFFATSTLFTGPGSIVFLDWALANPFLSIPQYLVVIVAIFWIYRLLFSKQRYF